MEELIILQALDEMTWRITSSISDLANSVDSMGAKLDQTLIAIHSQIDELSGVATRYHEVQSTEASERARREEKILEMLDNIQRRSGHFCTMPRPIERMSDAAAHRQQRWPPRRRSSI